MSSARQREFGPVSVKRRARRHLQAEIMAACRWTRASLSAQVANVAKLAPAITGGVLAPPGDVEALPCAVTGPCGSDQDAVPTVGKQRDRRACIRQLRRRYRVSPPPRACCGRELILPSTFLPHSERRHPTSKDHHQLPEQLSRTLLSRLVHSRPSPRVSRGSR